MSLFSDFVPLFLFSFACFKRDKITEQLLGTESLNNYKNQIKVLISKVFSFIIFNAFWPHRQAA